MGWSLLGACVEPTQEPALGGVPPCSREAPHVPGGAPRVSRGVPPCPRRHPGVGCTPRGTPGGTPLDLGGTPWVLGGTSWDPGSRGTPGCPGGKPCPGWHLASGSEDAD